MDIVNSSVLLVLDLPQAALVGVDLLAFTSTPRFRGVKNVPPGQHVVFVGSSTAFSERHGIWFHVDENNQSRPSLTITRWDPTSESLVLETSETEHLRWRANLGSVWKEGLTPYRQTSSTSTSSTNTPEFSPEPLEWTHLTSHITPTTISRITTSTSSISSASSAQQDIETIPGLSLSESQVPLLTFFQIDLKQTWAPDTRGRERTVHAQDRSWALNHLISTHLPAEGEEGVLGELQFCFAMVLTLNNFSCLEQWRRLLGLLLTCREAVGGTRAGFFVKVLRSLKGQLRNCDVADTGLLDLSEEGSGVLKVLLVKFRRGVEGLGVGAGVGLQDVVDELEEVEEFLQREHGWSFGGKAAKGGGVLELEDGEEVRYEMGTLDDEEDETGEYAPQVVDLTPEQARMLDVGGADGLHQRLDRTRLDEKSDEEDEASIQGDVSNSDTDGEEEMRDLDDMDSRF